MAQRILELAAYVDAEVTVHHFVKRKAMSTFVRDAAVVIGAAAHAMLPTYAAGATVTVESAACLGLLLDNLNLLIDKAFIKSRLGLFNELRLGRCNMVMLLSNAGFAGRGASGVQTDIRRLYDGPLPDSMRMPWCAENRELFFSYDVFKETSFKLLALGGI